MTSQTDLEQLLQSVVKAQAQLTGIAKSVDGKAGQGAKAIAEAAKKSAKKLNEALVEAGESMPGFDITNDIEGLKINGLPGVHFLSAFKINDETISLLDPDEIFDRIRTLMNSGKNIELHFEGPLAAPLMPLMTVAKQIANVMLNLPPLPGLPPLPSPPPFPSLPSLPPLPGKAGAPVPAHDGGIISGPVLCLAMICLTVGGLGLPLVAGTSVIMMAVAAAIVIAVSKGYDVDAQLCDKVGGTAGGVGAPGTSLDLCKKIVLTRKS